MKQIIIAIILILSFTGCGSSKNPPVKNKKEITNPVIPSPPPILSRWFVNKPNNLFYFNVKQKVLVSFVEPDKIKFHFPSQIKENVYVGVHERIAKLHQSNQSDIIFDENLNETVEFTIEDNNRFRRDFLFPGYGILGKNTRILKVTKLANTMDYDVEFVHFKKPEIIQKLKIHNQDKGFSGELKIADVNITFNDRKPDKNGFVYIIKKRKK